MNPQLQFSQRYLNLPIGILRREEINHPTNVSEVKCDLEIFFLPRADSKCFQRGIRHTLSPVTKADWWTRCHKALELVNTPAAELPSATLIAPRYITIGLQFLSTC